MQHAVFEDVRIEGHLIDSGIDVRRSWTSIIAMGGEFEIALVRGRPHQRGRLGRGASRARRQPGAARWRSCARSSTHGAVAVRPVRRRRSRPRRWTASSPTASTRPPTWRPTCASPARWVRVANPEMDLGVRVDPAGRRRRGRSPWPTCARATCTSSATRASACTRTSVRATSRRSSSCPARSRARSPRRRSWPRSRACCATRAPPARTSSRSSGPAVVHTGAAERPRAAGRAGLHQRAVRRQRRRDARHRERAVRHVARRRARGRRAVARRPRAPPARDQRRARLRLDRRGGRAGRAHQGPHVHAREDGRAVRAGRLDSRRRPAAGRHHRRASRRRTRCAPTRRTPARA